MPCRAPALHTSACGLQSSHRQPQIPLAQPRARRALAGGSQRFHTVRTPFERSICRTASPQISLGGALVFAGAPDVDDELVTLEEVQKVVARRGLNLTLKTLGPFYRFVIRDNKAGSQNGADADKNSTVLAVSSGFTVPAMGLMHCDSLQIFTRGLRGSEGERLRGGILGLGLLMGGAVFSYGYSCGCRKAEILAIKDDDLWHKRLVSYYSRFGFKPVREVGDSGLRDLPDLLVWGGVGMRMDADIAAMLAQWSPAIRHSGRTAQERARATTVLKG